jgi:peptidoglycan/LPS O-acetylase OafA/YrhL
MAKEELTLEEQVERIRAKRNGGGWKDRARRILNNVFLILAVCGVVTYFSGEESHINGMILVGIAMAFKLVEIVIRIVR